MPRTTAPKTKKTPKYSHHTASGQAVVRIDGRDRYLGQHGTPESHAAYARLIHEWRIKQQEAVSQSAREALEAAGPVAVGNASLAEVLLEYRNRTPEPL